jgi:hypothetical protein
VAKKKLISVRTAAEVVNVTPRRIQQLIRDGRVPGAQFIAGVWLLPEDFIVLPAQRRRPGKIPLAD